MVMTGSGLTVITTSSCDVKQALLPITVYVVVTFGVATGLAQSVQLRLDEGPQVKPDELDALSVIDPPGQIESSGMASTGKGLSTKTVT
jgi:hypothetical protein